MFFLERAVVLNKRSIHHRILAVSMDQACDPVSTILHVFTAEMTELTISQWSLPPGSPLGRTQLAGRPALFGGSGATRRAKALRLMAIRQARLKRVASSASCYERMVNGRSAVNL